MATNKVIINNVTEIDLTEDTAVAADVAAGKTFHLASGEIAEGTNTNDSDTSDDTATASEILATKTAHARGQELVGTMPNVGQQTIVIDDADATPAISAGYHDGSGTATIDPAERAKLIAGNIKSGVEILGVTGSYSGEGAQLQGKNVTPTHAAQTVQPDAGYDGLSVVNVAAIPVTRVANPAGGDTVTV